MTEISLQQNLNAIIEARQPLVKRISHLCTELDALETVLKNIADYGNSENSKLTDDQKASIAALPTGSVIKQTSGIKSEMKKLESRFSRETVNIGVIGRARQGKSKLLQSLTGLGKREIPDADGMHCTGVRSSVCHQVGIETYANVYFYNANEFLATVLAPYFVQLNLGNAPQSLEEFSTRDLSISAITTAVNRAKFEHLKKYQASLNQYRDLLNHLSPLRITQQDIPKFITQYDPDDPSIAYYNYLAVKEVRIFCTFPDEEVGKIAVVDMPGLGDTGIGDEERLVNTLGQDIDFILFVRMPKHTGDYWADVDVELYDIANRALQNTSLDNWSFQVLNLLSDNSNLRNCQDLKETIGAHHLRVAKVIIVNCANSSDVQKNILPLVLEHIAAHIKVLDQRFIQAMETALINLKGQVSELVKQAGNSIVLVGGTTEYSIFSNLFREFWNEKLTLDLEDLRIDLWQNRQQRDPNLTTALDKAYHLAKNQTGIPDIEEIRKQSKQKGAINKAYYDLLDVVRVTLSEKFQSQLDSSLKISVDAMKQRVADIFFKAGLSALIVDKENASLLQEIFGLLEQNSDHNTDRGMQKIHQGFQDLIEFNLYYRGLAQPRIRKHLDYLTAPREGIAGAECAPDLGPNPSAEAIAEMLQTLHDEALYKINEELRDLLWEPSMSAFSVIEEFLDCVLRAEDVETSWRNFLWDHREKVWANEFKWQNLVASLSAFSTPNRLSVM
ncbi:hypothetical protein [Thiospirillum jenense]|uniref:Dynamin family protein n=1 Tax=Thiospirillum jenense TaxID=1653858 RepID=A0A839HES6_9GAMM|nr:hypothetical protein [Thiospirillum jenense]MBB1127161.1 hypothetical protein [Thiospirillum jenense]